MSYKYFIKADCKGVLYVNMTYSAPLGGLLTYDYTRTLGNLGKHGIQGYFGENFLCFEGGKVIFQPEDCYMKREILENVEVEILFNDKIYKYEFNNLDWFGMYDLRKKCFSIGDFEIFDNLLPSNKIKVLFEVRNTFNYPKNEICANIRKLYEYYYEIFGEIGVDVYEIFIFGNVEDRKLFGGAGQSSQGSTLNPFIKRDWELLSHRMFHAFMDSCLKNIDLLLPPYLWIYEGLAVYHEIQSVKVLNIISDVEKCSWQLLKRRYVYATLTYGNDLKLIPQNECYYFKEIYKLEFLHYTQAPLIIKKNDTFNIIKMLLEGRALEEIAALVDIDLGYLNTCKGYQDINSFDDDIEYFEQVLRSWGFDKTN